MAFTPGGKDIWEGLYEFPLIETEQPTDFATLQETEAFRHLFDGSGRLHISVDIPEIKHVLSHQVLHTVFYRVEIEKVSDALNSYLVVPYKDIERYAVPRLVHIYLEKLNGNLSE